MEVHAHSHTVPIAIGRKKWTHYFWEFLMLFLAVFCGFLAEYQLVNFWFVQNTQIAVRQANSLDSLIKKEYHLQ